MDGLAPLDRMDAREPLGHTAAAAPPRSSNGRGKWTREAAIAAIQEVAVAVGHAPSIAEMTTHGYGGVCQLKPKLGCTYGDLVREAGLEPNSPGTGPSRRHASERTTPPKPKPKELEAPLPTEPTTPDPQVLAATFDAKADRLERRAAICRTISASLTELAAQGVSS